MKSMNINSTAQNETGINSDKTITEPLLMPGSGQNKATEDERQSYYNTTPKTQGCHMWFELLFYFSSLNI